MDFLDEIPEEEENELIKAIKELTQEIRELKDAINEMDIDSLHNNNHSCNRRTSTKTVGISYRIWKM